MGLSSWFGGSSSSSSTPVAEVSPGRSARETCWHGRDAYFQCLDSNGVNVPGQEGATVCQEELKAYELGCAKSWVDYFNKRRVLQMRQELMERKAAEQRGEPGGPITK